MMKQLTRFTADGALLTLELDLEELRVLKRDKPSALANVFDRWDRLTWQAKADTLRTILYVTDALEQEASKP